MGETALPKNRCTISFPWLEDETGDLGFRQGGLQNWRISSCNKVSNEGLPKSLVLSPCKQTKTSKDRTRTFGHSLTAQNPKTASKSSWNEVNLPTVRIF